MNLFKNLKKPLLIVGIGNPMKGDDGAGPAFADKLAAAKKKTAVINCLEVPENYLKKIIGAGAATIILADAVEMGEKPGSVRVFDTESIRETGVSTHGISLELIAETIKQESGAEVFLLGIQPKSVKLGEELTDEVLKAVNNLVELLP
jgi:hydrogenase 3 maturation protease